MNVAEAIEKLSKKVQSADLPKLMRLLTPAQSQLAMQAIAGAKSKNLVLAETAGKEFVRGLNTVQQEEIGKIVGADTVTELRKAAGL